MQIVKRSNRNQANTIQDAISKAFNALGRAHIQAGHTVIPVMHENRIIKMSVTHKKDDFAMLTDPDGETWGVVFDG